MKKVYFKDLGNKEYKEVWDFQEDLLAKKVQIKKEQRQQEVASIDELPQIQNDLFFVEHPLVYTLGKTGHESNMLLSEEERNSLGIEYFHINRGGDITFHGPGQIVGYPIIDLEQFKTDLGWYLRSLEQVIIDTVAEYGITAGRSKGETGVWLEADEKGRERKICAMGIRCSRWITMHGFALNVNTNMDYFNYIVPCGIQGKDATSIEKEVGHPVDMEEVKTKLKKHFARIFDVEVVD